MIPVHPVPEPPEFADAVAGTGVNWLAANPAPKKVVPLWQPFTSQLAEGFANRCAYAAMLDPTGGTVDHYRSIKNHRHLAYTWSNYRFASASCNASKGAADDAILDPYEVGPDWFEIVLPSLQLRVTDAVPALLRDKAEFTLRRLKLRDGERIIRWRKAWYDLYRLGEITLEGLRAVAPQLASAVEAHDR